MKPTYYIVLVLSAIALCLSCKKDFLDQKPQSSRVIPTTLGDFQKILDGIEQVSPGVAELSSDDYQIADNSFASVTREYQRNAYTWNAEIYPAGFSAEDWNEPYRQVFYANVAIEGLDKLNVTAAEKDLWNTLKGTALFIRAFAFYHLAQVFSPVYDSNAANNPYGIPLRLTADINAATKRSTVKETYDQIFADLQEARNLLPAVFQAANRNRPSKAAVDALLARIYLGMGDYTNAGVYAGNALSFYNKLIDYNSLSQTSLVPFVYLNDETLYQGSIYSVGIVTNLLTSAGFTVNTLLRQSYQVNDLRLLVYFNAAGNIKGRYSGAMAFNGLATDELFLIRAECYARAGKVAEAMDDLNNLLRNRYKKNPDGSSTYVNQTAANANEALTKVLLERRKELVLRGLRWTDLRRFNKEGMNITLTRALNGITYTLPPNDPRYVFPIPNDVINFTGIAQNPR